ncbi:MAG: DUF4097 family beta strand repeat-containing protein [Spirosomataceae bacterium]
MKKYLFAASLVLAWASCYAQTTFKTTASSGLKNAVVFIERNNLVIEGTTSNEILIEIDEPIRLPETAQGLQRLSVKGLTDNTNLGLSVTQENGILAITEVCNCYAGTYRIKLPTTVNLTVTENSPWGGNKWIVRNVTGDLDIRSESSSVTLDRAGAGIQVLLTQGKIIADFAELSTKPITLASRHGIVSVTIPDNAKSTVSLKTCNGYGDIFTDFDTATFEKSEDGLSGKINGGGTPLSLVARYGNVYLRKRKGM